MVFKTPAEIVTDAELGDLRRVLIVTALKSEMLVSACAASDAMLARYIRDGELFVENAAGVLL